MTQYRRRMPGADARKGIGARWLLEESLGVYTGVLCYHRGIPGGCMRYIRASAAD